jgi:hypothetical protein
LDYKAPIFINSSDISIAHHSACFMHSEMKSEVFNHGVRAIVFVW